MNAKLFVRLLLLFSLSISLEAYADPLRPSLARSAESGEKHNIVLIVIDTVGAKHFGRSVEGRPTTPNLSKLADEGVVFENAFSGAPWTRPAIGSIFTGYTALAHGMRKVATKERFNPATPTLPQRLQQLGYETAGIVSHILISPETDFARGFDFYRMVDVTQNVNAAVTSQQVSQFALRWLEQYNSEKRGKPFFLFLHYFDPHFNYNGHPEFDRTSWYKGILSPGLPYSRYRRLSREFSGDDIKFAVGLYREEIEYTDQKIGSVLQAIKEISRHDDTSVVVVADHGEEFKEHGSVGHGRTMFNEILHVPLLVWNPRLFKPARITTWVSTYDIFPTLVPFEAPIVPQEYHGRSLLPLIAGVQTEQYRQRSLFAEVDHRASIMGVMQEPYKYVFYPKTGQRQLFNLADDPLERMDIMTQAPATASKFGGIMESFFKAHEKILNSRSGETAEPLLPKEVENLKTLGYL